MASCNVTVGNGSRLTIEPGVQVRFGGQAAGQQLLVSAGGTLVAEGTLEKPIAFTSHTNSPQAGDWTNIIVSEGATAHFSYCEIAYGGRFGFFPALNIGGGDVSVRHCQIHDNLGDAIYLFGTGLAPVIEHTRIENNGKIAINQWIPDASPTYHQLTAAGNGTDAVVIAGGFIHAPQAWSFANAGIPIIVNGTVEVWTDGTLFLEAGSALEFDGSLTSLRISGALYALGTPDRPIVLTGHSASPGSWAGLGVTSSGKAVLENCEVSYSAGMAVASSQTVIQSCRVHHNSVVGIQVDNDAQPVIVNNSIRDNPFGLKNTSQTAVVDARRNWWGDPSGPYHPATNPGGLGNIVSDRVLFADWLRTEPVAPPPVSDLSVDISGPRIVSPGGPAEFTISYQYVGDTPLEDAVMVAVLPPVGTYEGSSGDGIFWSGRHEVFWKLGTLSPPLATGERVLRMRYLWGLPEAAFPIMVLIGAANWPGGSLDVAPYLGYTATELTASTPLAPGQVSALLQGYPDLRTLYQEAIGQGFIFAGAVDSSFTNGRTVSELVLIKPPAAAIFLQVEDGRVLALSLDPETGTIRQVDGGLRMSLADGAIETFGAWTANVNRQEHWPQAEFGQCVSNCLNKEFGVEYWLGNVSRGIEAVLSAIDCVSCAETGDCGKCALDLIKTKGAGEINSVYKCFSECGEDPSKYRCQSGDVILTCQSAANWSFLDIDDRCAYREYKCDPETGQWVSPPLEHTVWGSNYSCVEGQGCVDCPGGECYDTPPDERASLLQCAPAASSERADQQRQCDSQCPLVRTGKDPNAKLGLVGDLLPGQPVTYTVTYENEGAGQAFGVFIVDKLSEHLDEDTLTIYGDAIYVPHSRTIIWDVGELAPKGQIGSTGAVSLTIRLRDDLPGGTVVVNQAKVHFPSVPEITPTNPVVNQVYPVVALPQAASTDANQPIIVTLQGRDAARGALTFAVETQPQHGELSGAPPQVTYTPAADFNGQDSFTYTASNGISRSRPAEVTVLVRPAASDTTPPRVTWTLPQADSVVARFTQTPVADLGTVRLYAPGVRVGFSEALTASTVNTGTVLLATEGGQPIGLYVSYVGIDNTVTAYPTQPLQSNTGYVVTLAPEITDAIGNRLPTPVTWRFRTGQSASRWLFLPLTLK